jgi:histidinol-phosphate aminotransferase
MRIPFTRSPAIVRLDRNEDVFGWPPELSSRFLEQLTATDLAHYPVSSGLLDRLSSSLGVSDEHLWVTAGCDEGLALAFQTFAAPRSTVIALTPSYGMYPVLASLVGARLLTVSDRRNPPALVDLIARQIRRRRPTLVSIASPNQPTGTQFTPDEFAELATELASTGGTLLIDEAYFGFGATTALNLVHDHANVLITRTFSKAFGLAGVRVGFNISHPDRTAELSRAAPICESTSIGIAAATFALDNLPDVEKHVAQIVRGRNLLAERLTDAGFRVINPATNFIVMQVADFREGERLVATIERNGYLIRGPLSIPDWGWGLRITAVAEDRVEHVASTIIEAAAPSAR